MHCTKLLRTEDLKLKAYRLINIKSIPYLYNALN